MNILNDRLVKDMDTEKNLGVGPITSSDSFDFGELTPSSNMSKLKFNIIKMHHLKFKKIMQGILNAILLITLFVIIPLSILIATTPDYYSGGFEGPEREPIQLYSEDGVWVVNGSDNSTWNKSTEDLRRGDRLSMRISGEVYPIYDTTTTCYSSYDSYDDRSSYYSEDDMECYTDYYYGWAIDHNGLQFVSQSEFDIYPCINSICDIEIIITSYHSVFNRAVIGSIESTMVEYCNPESCVHSGVQ